MPTRRRLPRAWCLLAPLTAFMLGLMPADAARAWWNDDWKYRKEISVDLRSLEAGDGTALEGVSVPIGLHSGNFPYFLMMAPGGEDIRVIAEDDETPLPFHVESVDLVSGLARIWVRLPQLTPGQSRVTFRLYYGNDEAVAAGDAAQSWDEHMLLAYHFAETEGLPRDAAGYARHAVRSSATLLAPGVVGSGAGFEPGLSLELPPNVISAADAGDGLSMSFWVRTGAGAGGRLLGQTGGFTLRLEDLTAVLELPDGRQLSPNRILADDRWQHLAITSSPEGIRFFLNGAPAGFTPGVQLPAAPAPLVFGASAGEAADGFEGAVDEVRFAAVARHPEWFRLAHALQGPGADLVEFGQDQSAESRGTARLIAMLRPLLGNIGSIGWTVIGILGVLGLLALDAMIGKQLLLRRDSRADRHFIEVVESGVDPLQPLGEAELGTAAHHSALNRVAAAARDELARLPEWSGSIPASFLNSVRSAMDAQIVEETNRLNEKMVWITLAVSGGPFLGLLGTVIGVMLTFAAIAQTGDMNVNTIAPGVAAALTTTIAGLIVAIPALFGYNYLTGRITRELASLEVFADRLANSIAVMSAEQQQALKERRHAA